MAFIVPLVTAAASIYSSAHAANQRKKAERRLEGMKTPEYTPNPSILDYYKKALQRYNTNTSDTAEYKLQQQNIKQGITQGIAAAQDRRLGGAITPALIQGGNNAMLRANVAAEQRKSGDLARLGQAAGMRSGEEGKAFQYNKIYPFEKQYNLLASKAAGQAQVQNQAMQDAYNNLGATLALGYDAGTKSGEEDFNWSNIFKWVGFRGGNRSSSSITDYDDNRP